VFLQQPELACRFDASVVLATFVSTSVMACVSPPHAAGSVQIRIANNNQDFDAVQTYVYDRALLWLR
jgi:hypothetical protein